MSWKRGSAAVFVVMLFFAEARLLRAQVAQAPAAMGIPQSESVVGNTNALAREAQDWLVELVKINTTNPPGNEQASAKYIAGILTKEGITPEFLDVAPGRSALVARLRSSAVADPSKALLLVAHMDVVGVDKSKWTVDPFGSRMGISMAEDRSTTRACWWRTWLRSSR